MRLFLKRKTALARPAITPEISITMPDGAWKYMTFWISSIVDSYGAFAIMMGAYANIAAATIEAGQKPFAR